MNCKERCWDPRSLSDSDMPAPSGPGRGVWGRGQEDAVTPRVPAAAPPVCTPPRTVAESPGESARCQPRLRDQPAALHPSTICVAMKRMQHRIRHWGHF